MFALPNIPFSCFCSGGGYLLQYITWSIQDCFWHGINKCHPNSLWHAYIAGISVQLTFKLICFEVNDLFTIVWLRPREKKLLYLVTLHFFLGLKLTKTIDNGGILVNQVELSIKSWRFVHLILFKYKSKLKFLSSQVKLEIFIKPGYLF